MFRKPLLPWLIWTVFIAILTLTPGNYIPKIISFADWLSADKLLHIFIFGIYGFLTLEGFTRYWEGRISKQNVVITGLLLGMVFAFFTEMMQKLVIPGRSGNYYDFLADVLGLLLGYLSWHLIRRNDKKKLSGSKKYI